MTEFNTMHHERTSSNFCGKYCRPQRFCALGILMLSLIDLALWWMQAGRAPAGGDAVGSKYTKLGNT